MAILGASKGKLDKGTYQSYEGYEDDLEPEELYKIQRPIVTNNPNVEILVYNKARTHEGMFAPGEDLMDLFKGQYKIYVRGRWNRKTGKLHIGSVAVNEYF